MLRLLVLRPSYNARCEDPGLSRMQGATRENSRSYLTEEQRSSRPKMGPGRYRPAYGRFWAATASLVGHRQQACSLLAPCFAPKSTAHNAHYSSVAALERVEDGGEEGGMVPGVQDNRESQAHHDELLGGDHGERLGLVAEGEERVGRDPARRFGPAPELRLELEPAVCPVYAARRLRRPSPGPRSIFRCGRRAPCAER